MPSYELTLGSTRSTTSSSVRSGNRSVSRQIGNSPGSHRAMAGRRPGAGRSEPTDSRYGWARRSWVNLRSTSRTISAPLPAGVAGITVKEIEFYEGGGFFRPGPAEQAAVSFARSKVRRIYWVLKGRNRLHRVRAQRPNIVGYYYRPDGTLLGETRNRYLVAPEIEDVVLVEGLGWPVAGEWEPGRYRFELEQDHRVVEEEYFEITDPFLKPRLRPRVVHFGILDAGVFAAGESAPDGRDRPKLCRPVLTARGRTGSGLSWSS